MILIGRHYDGGYTTKLYGPFDSENEAEEFLMERNFILKGSGTDLREELGSNSPTSFLCGAGTVPLSVWYSHITRSGAVVMETKIENRSKFSDQYGEDIWEEDND